MNKYGVTAQKAAELERLLADLGIIENDLKEVFVRSSGPGGQKVNKTSTCVQLTHLPSGLIVKAQQSRSQALNRFYARRMLAELYAEKILGCTSARDERCEKIKRQKARRARRSKQKAGGSDN